jgi:hypothetical protein
MNEKIKKIINAIKKTDKKVYAFILVALILLCIALRFTILLIHKI